MKGAGALLVLLGCLSAALTLRRKERAGLAALCAMERCLGTLAHELTEKQRCLGELFAARSESVGEPYARLFFGRLHARMDRLGEESFSSLWAGCVRETLRPLGEECVNILLPLGDVLGGCDLQEQRAALERALGRLGALREEARRSRGDHSRLVFGALLGVGAFVVIVLI